MNEEMEQGLNEGLYDDAEDGPMCSEENTGIFIDLTEGKGNTDPIPIEHIQEDDDIIIGPSEHANRISENEIVQIPDEGECDVIPYVIYWESLLARLEACDSASELQHVAAKLKKDLRPLEKKKKNVHFDPECHYIDATATMSLPSDGPQNVHAIWTKGDGNCLGRTISTAYRGNDEMHIEVRVRIVIEGAVNKDFYLSEDYLNIGASLTRHDESLPEVYAKYSDHYVNGQKITRSTIEYLYFRELQDCCKINSYMGLWQIAQAASALDTPIQSVYPEGTDEVMRMDFHRLFFPVEVTPNTSDDPLIVMWTSVMNGTVPSHFVPLLHKRIQYDPFIHRLIIMVYLFQDYLFVVLIFPV